MHTEDSDLRDRGERPRPVIIKLHNSVDIQQITAAIREWRQLTYEGQKLCVQQDLSTAVKETLRGFNKVCERLIGLDVRFTMRFPAVLTFTYNGKKHSCLAKLRRLPLGKYTAYNGLILFSSYYLFWTLKGGEPIWVVGVPRGERLLSSVSRVLSASCNFL